MKKISFTNPKLEDEFQEAVRATQRFKGKRTREGTRIGVLEALNFFINQVKKGWSIEEAMAQVENCYNPSVVYFMCLELNNRLKK